MAHNHEVAWFAATRDTSLTEAHVRTTVAIMTMLAEPTRLRLLWALREGELGVSALAEAARCSPTAASQHLSKLRLAGPVHHRAEGRAPLYPPRRAPPSRLP